MTSCSRPGPEPKLLNLEMSAITMKPPRLPYGEAGKVTLNLTIRNTNSKNNEGEKCVFMVLEKEKILKGVHSVSMFAKTKTVIFTDLIDINHKMHYN